MLSSPLFRKGDTVIVSSGLGHPNMTGVIDGVYPVGCAVLYLVSGDTIAENYTRRDELFDCSSFVEYKRISPWLRGVLDDVNE